MMLDADAMYPAREVVGKGLPIPVSMKTFYVLVKEKRIHVRRLGGKIYLTKALITEFLDSLTE